MKPHPLDDWPLDEGDLSAAERKQLERRLADSPEIQDELNTWQAIEASLKESPLVGPETGFTLRWQAKLAAQRARRWTWQVRGLLALLLTGAAIAIVLIGLDALGSPAQLIASFLEAVIRVGQLLQASARFLTLLGDGWLATLGIFAFSASLAWLLVVWAAAMYRYGFSRVQNGV